MNRINLFKMRTTMSILHVTIILFLLASMNCWAHRFGGEGGRRRMIGSSELSPVGSSGEAHAPSWDYSWGWGYGSDSGKSPSGFGFGSGSGSGSGYGYGSGSGGAHGSGNGNEGGTGGGDEYHSASTNKRG